MVSLLSDLQTEMMSCFVRKKILDFLFINQSYQQVSPSGFCSLNMSAKHDFLEDEERKNRIRTFATLEQSMRVI